MPRECLCLTGRVRPELCCCFESEIELVSALFTSPSNFITKNDRPVRLPTTCSCPYTGRLFPVPHILMPTVSFPSVTSLPPSLIRLSRPIRLFVARSLFSSPPLFQPQSASPFGASVVYLITSVRSALIAPFYSTDNSFFREATNFKTLRIVALEFRHTVEVFPFSNLTFSSSHS